VIVICHSSKPIELVFRLSRFTFFKRYTSARGKPFRDAKNHLGYFFPSSFSPNAK